VLRLIGPLGHPRRTPRGRCIPVQGLWHCGRAAHRVGLQGPAQRRVIGVGWVEAARPNILSEGDANVGFHFIQPNLPDFVSLRC
jgi:hypothetical protein